MWVVEVCRWVKCVGGGSVQVGEVCGWWKCAGG